MEAEKLGMEWIKVTASVPRPFEVVWIFWRNREVLLGCKTDDIEHCEPHEGWYSFKDENRKWTDYWMRVSSSSIDKPQPPKDE